MSDRELFDQFLEIEDEITAVSNKLKKKTKKYEALKKFAEKIHCNDLEHSSELTLRDLYRSIFELHNTGIKLAFSMIDLELLWMKQGKIW